MKSTNKYQFGKKVKLAASTTHREVCNLWRLIVTVAQVMAAYILIPQDNLAFKVLGAILVVNGAIMAVNQYTKNN